MINPILQAIVIIGVISYLLLLFYFIHKQRLLLKYTLLWVLFGLSMLLLAVFPQVLLLLSQLIGIDLASNALFFLLFAFLILLVLSLTVICSGLNEKSRKLIQQIAILDLRVRTLEENCSGDTIHNHTQSLAEESE